MPSSLKIAVLEDNDELRELTLEVLRRHGYQSYGAYDAEGLNALMIDHQFDLLLLDLNLPGEDGLSVARRLKSVLPSLYIIMITALGSTSERIKGYEQGADIYLPKPVSEHELIAAVTSIARRVSHLRSEKVVGELILDFTKLQLVGAHVVSLSRTECTLLKQLIISENRKVEYFKFLEITNREVDAKSKASLEVQIVNLRKKITAAGFNSPSIRSIRNEGYELLCSISIVHDYD